MNAFRVTLYVLAVLSSLSCCVLLFRGWAQKRVRLLLWSALCFAGLTVNNVLLFVDLVVLPDGDLRLPRLAAALVGIAFMLYGFISDSD
jgi:hypothetical protein